MVQTDDFLHHLHHWNRKPPVSEWPNKKIVHERSYMENSGNVVKKANPYFLIRLGRGELYLRMMNYHDSGVMKNGESAVNTKRRVSSTC